MTRKQYKNVYEHYKFTTLWILFTFHHELSADVVPLLFHGDSDWIGGIKRNNTPLKSHHRNSRSLKVVFCAFQPRGFTLSKRPKDLLGSRDDSQVNPGNVVNGEPESRRFLLDMHNGTRRDLTSGDQHFHHGHKLFFNYIVRMRIFKMCVVSNLINILPLKSYFVIC